MNIKWQYEFVDPDTKKPLSLKIKNSKNQEVLEGTFLSSEKKEYPIVNGIPRFLSQEYYDSKKGKVTSEEIQVTRYFGSKWRLNACRSLGRSNADKELLKETFLALLGCKSIEELAGIYEHAETSLDVGCGVGWIEELFNVNTKTKMFAVDISQAVEEAYEKTKDKSNILVVQADLFKLPLYENYFDIVFSNGVIHHTANPKKAFSNLCRYLKPGGLIGVYIFNKKPLLREMADKEIRKLTTRMSFNECLSFAQQVTALGKAFDKIEQQLIIEEDIPLLNINKGSYKLQRFIYNNFLKCFYNKELGDEFSYLINMDWYHAKYQSHHTREEMQGWFDENHIKNVQVIQPPGWEYSGYFFSGRKEK
jgi:ubiquinone/menaquinone biosynthesis C-methylase UbiE/uncharacterized protein YbaR (Trm112 family)